MFLLRNVLTMIFYGAIMLLLRNVTENKRKEIKMKRKYEVLNSLKGKIREENENYRSLSKKTGISVNALNNKLNGYSVFDMREVSIIVEMLNINPNEIIKYFFPQMLRNQQIRLVSDLNIKRTSL